MSEDILFKRPRLLQNAMKRVRKYHSKCLIFGENLSGSLVFWQLCLHYYQHGKEYSRVRRIFEN